MIIKTAHKITILLCNIGIVDEERKEIIEIGFAILLNTILSDMTIILYSLLTHHLSEAIIYILLFGFIREYAGGYHANSYLSCYLEYTTIYLLLLSIPSLSGLKYWGMICLMIYSMIVPVEHPNHLLTIREKQAYRKKAWLRLALTASVGILTELFSLSIKEMIWKVTMTTSLLACLQLILNRMRRNNYEKSS